MNLTFKLAFMILTKLNSQETHLCCWYFNLSSSYICWLWCLNAELMWLACHTCRTGECVQTVAGNWSTRRNPHIHSPAGVFPDVQEFSQWVYRSQSAFTPRDLSSFQSNWISNFWELPISPSLSKQDGLNIKSVSISLIGWRCGLNVQS